jgi:hypothetical protein
LQESRDAEGVFVDEQARGAKAGQMHAHGYGERLEWGVGCLQDDRWRNRGRVCQEKRGVMRTGGRGDGQRWVG